MKYVFDSFHVRVKLSM